jgi:hypothetical protein
MTVLAVSMGMRQGIMVASHWKLTGLNKSPVGVPEQKLSESYWERRMNNPEWKRVVCASECIGPTEDGVEYKEVAGVLMGRRMEVEAASLKVG